MNYPDRIVEEALRTYSDALPSLGWERRIVQSILAQQRPARWLWLIAATAAALAIAWLHPLKHLEPAIVVSAPHREQLASIAPPQQNTPRKPRRFREPSVFPTPTPLTQEERILTDLAARSPLKLEELFHWREGPIEIQPIDIPALQIETNKEN